MPLHRRLPKRGFKNTSFALQAERDQSRPRAGRDRCRQARCRRDRRRRGAGQGRRAPARQDGVRLLGTGEIKAKVAFSVWGASKSAVAAVEKAGGSVSDPGTETRERRRRGRADPDRRTSRPLPRDRSWRLIQGGGNGSCQRMVSAAEQLAANLNFSALAKAEELKKRIWFTLGALLVYRFGTYIPLPGIDPTAWEQIFRQQAGGILGMFNMFSGGGIHRMAIFALNIMPYISASIIIQLMTTVSPTLEQLKKEGEQGRKVMNQYTRYLTVLLAAFQSYGIAIGLEGAGNVVADPGWFFRISTVITLTGGTMFLMWLGEQITARGIGNGISLIIMAGIVAELPSAIVGTLELGRQGALSTGLILAVLVMAVAVIAFIVFMERAQRRLLIQYPKRQVGNRMFEGQSSHLAAQAQHVGRHPADLRVLAAAVADDGCEP